MHCARLCRVSFLLLLLVGCAGPDRTALRRESDVATAGDSDGKGGGGAGRGGNGGTAGSGAGRGGTGGTGGSAGAGGAGISGNAGNAGNDASGGGADGGGALMDGPRPGDTSAGNGDSNAPRDMAGSASDAPRPADTALLRDTAPPDRADAASVVPGAKRVLLVSGNPNSVGAGDMKIRMRLEAKGFAVTLGDDDDVNANGGGMGMVVISNSVMTPKLMGRFRDIAIPVICMDPFVFVDLRMTGPMQTVDFEDETATQIAIASAGHAMAAGLTGMITVVTSAQDLPWGLPSSGAERVATVVNAANQNQVNHVAIFGYPTGAMMVGGTVAAARRVGFFASEPVAARLTPDGEKLLDAAIDWASR